MLLSCFKNKNIAAVCAACLILCTAHGAADKSYHFKHIKVEDGLAHNSVMAILQDNKGFMWFGTKGGLNRWDGYRFKTFAHDPSAPGNHDLNLVRVLYQDSRDNIWVGTDTGLYLYDMRTEAFRRFSQVTADGVGVTRYVNCITEDREGNLWIGVQWEGLFRYDPVRDELSLTAYVDGSPKGLSSNGVMNVWIDSDDIVWIGTIAGGLNAYDPADGSIRFFNLSYPGKRNDVTTIIEESPSSLLLGTSDNGVLRFDKQAGTLSPYLNNKEGTMYVRAMIKTDNESFWIGTESGLYVHNIPTGKSENMRLDYSDIYSLSANAIYAICQDRDKGIWIGTYFGGVNYLSPDHSHFDKYYPTGQPDALSGNAVREFQQDAKGNLWIGTEDNGLNYFDPGTGLFRNYTPSDSALSSNNIHGLFIDGDRLLVGYFMHGLDIVDLKKFTVRNHSATYTPDGLGDNSVFSIRKRSEGTYWIGTLSGLYIFDIGKETFTRVYEVGANTSFFDIMEDSRGLIWFCTEIGLFRYNPRLEQWVHYENDPEDPSALCNNATICATEDSKGNVWVATGGGVCMYDRSTDRFKTYTTADGLSNNVVHKVLEDAAGRLWISTNNGLSVLNPETEKFTVFTHNNGLLSNQFNYKSGIRTSDNKLYFGSIQGFIGIDPIRSFEASHPHEVVITRFDLFNREVSPSDEDSPLEGSVVYGSPVELHRRQSSFGFEFSALNYNASEMTRYAYMMEGLEEDWNYISHNQRVSYSNVPSGRYVFKVRAAGSDGTWNDNVAGLPIRIKPPLVASTAGIMVEIFLGLCLIFFAFVFYRRRVREKHRRMVADMRAAEDIALHKAKISFFTSITHEIRTPLSLIKAPYEQIVKTGMENPEVEENLEIMGSNINRLLNLTNELLDFSKVNKDGFKLHPKITDVGALLDRSLAGFRLVLRDRKIVPDVSLPYTPIITRVDPEILVKIFTNLLGNASKFAAERISITLQDDTPRAGMFRLSISNDGPLISPANRDNVFKAFFQERNDQMNVGTGLGLPLVKQLVELHSGRIYIDAGADDENRFVVEIPKKDETVESPSGETKSDPAARAHRSDETQPDHRVNVIVAEDESSMRDFLCKALSKWYNVTGCVDGKEALAALAEKSADIVVTDFVMPGMDGLELCRTIKTEMAYSHIPVIMLTAKTDLDSRIEGLKVGVDAYIDKPFSVEHIHICVEKLLSTIDNLREKFRNDPDTPAGSIATNETEETFIGKMNSIVMEHIHEEDFSIDQMAEIMNISRSNLYRKIKGISHLAPNEFIRLCRLKRAAELFNEGHYRINEICYLVGFNSPSYFTKCFQKQFGISPKEYIQRKK